MIASRVPLARRALAVCLVLMALPRMTQMTENAEAQVLPNCTLGMSSVAFGSYNPLSATSQDTTGTLSFSCNLTAPLPTIALSRGASSTYHPRTMLGPGGGTLSYNIYLDALHTVVWGDGSDLSTSKFVGIGLIGSVTFFGSIPPNQNAGAGAYSDSLVATIFF